MNTPAEAALAPGGLTQTITGTLAFKILWTISLIDMSSPPGVSMRTMIALDALVSAASICLSRKREDTGSMTPSSSTNSMTLACEFAGIDKSMVPATNKAAPTIMRAADLLLLRSDIMAKCP